jgi:hypothetical protein
VHEVLLISAAATSIADSIKDRIGADVRSVSVSPNGSMAESLDQVLETLESETHRHVLVIDDGEGSYDVMPIED